MKNNLVLLLFLGSLGIFQAFIVGPEAQPFPAQKTSEPCSEALQMEFRAVFQDKVIKLGMPLTSKKADGLRLQTLRFYLSHFVFLKNGKVVFEEKDSYHLLDWENENSLVWPFKGSENLDFDQIQFKLGIDSLTHISGAMGGDLDPTKGMFWTWQSGYVNFKVEGIFEKCPTRNHEFQFHLGGYLAPNQTVQQVQLSVPKGKNLRLELDLGPFFEKIDWAKKYSIMSPCKEAVAAAQILAQSFSIYGE